MLTDFVSLGLPAITIGFVHCICGPDHYVPFVAMSRVGLWSLRKTLLITFLCGVGHVVGSAAIGFIGISLGLIVSQLEEAESVRGGIAAWMLVAFGVLYTLWGFYYARKRAKVEPEGIAPQTDEGHGAPVLAATSSVGGTETAAASGGHMRMASWIKKPGKLTPWILFVIFLFGPCEPLIPMVMVPASQANMLGVFWVTFLFGLTTIVTMTTLVTLMYIGAFALEFSRFQRWGHACAGSVVLVCGAAILLLGV